MELVAENSAFVLAYSEQGGRDCQKRATATSQELNTAGLRSASAGVGVRTTSSGAGVPARYAGACRNACACAGLRA
eukprot:142461-Pleurochrysis_carterae.AAC.1